MNVLTRENFGLPVERQVIVVFANQHVGQKPRPGADTFNRVGRKRSLRERFTAGAGHAWADDPVHDKATVDRFQFLGNIFADLVQGTAAVIARVPGRQNLILPIQMLGQRCVVMLALGGRWLGGDTVVFLTGILFGMLRVSGGFNLLIILKIKRQLVEAFGLGVEPRLA